MVSPELFLRNFKMAESKLLVKTTLGTTILDLESRINVHLNKDLYLEKDAIDLNVGDMVVYKNEYIETTLDEAKQFLNLSPQYVRAKMQVMEKNSKNKHVPILRTELWRGILAKKASYNSSLEGIIRKEEEDFCNSDYDEAIEMISNAINENGIEISKAAIKNWLKGETYAPRDWQIFNSLAKINPIFKEFDESNQNVDGKYSNYKFFVTKHQEAVRNLPKTLAKLMGKESDSEQEIERKQNEFDTKVNEEVELIIKDLMERKSKEYSLARVVSVERLYRKDPRVKEVKRNPAYKLSRGIETKKPELDITSKGTDEFMEDYFFINGLFSTSLNIYIDSSHPKEFEPFVFKNNKFKGYQEGIKQLFLEKYNQPEIYESSHGFQRMKFLLDDDTARINYAEKLTDLLLDDLSKGKFDERFLLPRDSYKKLLEAEYKIVIARPRRLAEFELADDEFGYCGRAIDKIVHKGLKSEEDKEEYKRLVEKGKEVHERLTKLKKRIEERLHLKVREEYHNGNLLRFLELNSKRERNKEDIERCIKEYDLENFREIIKYKHAPLYPEIMNQYKED